MIEFYLPFLETFIIVNGRKVYRVYRTQVVQQVLDQKHESYGGIYCLKRQLILPWYKNPIKLLYLKNIGFLASKISSVKLFFNPSVAVLFLVTWGSSLFLLYTILASQIRCIACLHPSEIMYSIHCKIYFFAGLVL